MLALCSQENPPTPLSTLFNSEGPKNPIRIPWPEFSVTASGLMTCSSLREFEPVSRPFNPRIGPMTPSRKAGIWRKEKGVQGDSMAEAMESQCQGPRDPFVQLPEVTDIFCDCLESRIFLKKACSKKMPVCNWVNKDQRKTVTGTAHLLSVSGIYLLSLNLSALIKHKQKSLP